MSLLARILLAFGLLAGASGAFAQDAGSPGADIFSQGLVAPNLDTILLPAPAETLATPETPPPALRTAPLPIAPGRSHSLVLEARLVAEGAPLTSGLIWRVFGAQPGPDGQLPLFAETPPGGTTTVQLPPGDYFVHAAFGRAGATKHVTIEDDDQMESLVIDAGGLKLDSVVGEDQPIPPGRLTFEVLQPDETGELVTVVPDASPGRVLRLSAGGYHVISRYGNVNAVVRADIEVKAGRLTEAVMRHTGAEVTLKLVSEEGGEAIANTNWTVTTQDGITVHESIGAFPSIILASGTYTAVAKHQDQIYSRDFTVETGLERDIEVRLSDIVQPETGPIVSPGTGGVPMEP
jgi:hypothetical protein